MPLPGFRGLLEYPAMPDESNVIPPARLVRWTVIGVLVLFAVVLYFRHGRELPPLGAAPDTTAARTPPAR